MPIYLDHATTAWPKAQGVARAMVEALELPASPGRGSSSASLAAARVADDLRAALAGLIHADDPRRVVLTAGATEALNLAIRGVALAHWMRARTPLPVLTTPYEHNAVRRPLHDLERQGLVAVTVAPPTAGGGVDPDAMVPREAGPALVVMTGASNVTGVIQPVEHVASRLLSRPDTLLLVDASQTAGLVRSSVPLPEVGIDLLAFSGHKALGGPPGVGALYVGPRAHPLQLSGGADGSARLWPVVAGGTGGDSADPSMPASLPGRFEPGTRNTPALAGLLAAARAHPGADAALAQVRTLTAALLTFLSRVPGVTVLAPDTRTARVGVVSFNLGGFSPEEAAMVLEGEFGIIVRAGLHCAPGAHAAMGTLARGGSVRASVGLSTTLSDVDALISALHVLAA